MSIQRTVEVFSAGCAVCDETVAVVQRLACPSCGVEIVSTRDAVGAERARRYGITRVPAVAVDGRLLACCAEGGPTEATLRDAGIGRPVG
ncbi:MAG: thioredoxin family protein [Nitrospirae bacterium]|nr:thioredoxin family protein [Nitrospirota bacterium]